MVVCMYKVRLLAYCMAFIFVLQVYPLAVLVPASVLESLVMVCSTQNGSARPFPFWVHQTCNFAMTNSSVKQRMLPGSDWVRLDPDLPPGNVK